MSVVIPVHNRAHLLGRAVDSVLAQSFGDFEVVIVDDGSSDDVGQALAPRYDARIRVVQLARTGGVARARNAGMRAARGRLVAFLDSDDEWRASKLERQIACFQRLPAADDTIVSCRFLRYDDHTCRQTPSGRSGSSHEPFDRMVRGVAPLPSGAVVPRALLIAVGGLDEALPAFADYELWLRLAHRGVAFAEVDRLLVVKHENRGSQISRDPDALLRGFDELDRKWSARIRERCGTIAYRRWRAWLLTSIQHVRIRLAVTRGERREAWGHWVAMCPHALWSRRYLVYGLGLAALGPEAYDALAGVKSALHRLGRTAE